MTPAPSVSVCVPTYNNADTVRTCIESACSQSFDDLEILVVDDSSTDNTIGVVESVGDARVRIVQNPVNVGLTQNHNECVRHARGQLIKFLHADDLLLPNCVEAMATPMLARPSIGLVFAPRRVVADDDPEWAERYGRLDLPLQPLAPIGSGATIVSRYLQSGTSSNWIGEPTAVMARRSCFFLVGGFNPYMAQMLDMDMWLRILAGSEYGWVDEELTVRCHHSGASTVGNKVAGRDWLDELWMLEGLLASPYLGDARRALRWRRLKARVRASRSLATANWSRDRLTELHRYAAVSTCADYEQLVRLRSAA